MGMVFWSKTHKRSPPFTFEIEVFIPDPDRRCVFLFSDVW